MLTVDIAPLIIVALVAVRGSCSGVAQRLLMRLLGYSLLQVFYNL
jgi:hypothetical protein